MKKIGIATITIGGTYNLGNKLQAYALQEYLRENGYLPETIRYEADYVQSSSKESVKTDWKKIFTQSFCQSLDDACRIIGRRLHRKTLLNLRDSRKKQFEDFETKYISFTDKVYYSDSDFSELIQRYDFFITGSDQVWNPYYEGADPFYYLQFAPKGKRIAYAPSIAVERIPEKMKSNICRWLQEMDHVSIREEEGRSLIMHEFGVEAELVCDPVFLLNRQQWHSVARAPDRTGKYFAVYILGKKTIQTKRLIKKMETIFQIPAVDIYSCDDWNSVFAGPEAFLGWIENAEFVLTDSFHGAAFSVIFDRPMAILERESVNEMGSRIRNLLQIIGAGDRSAARILDNPDLLDISDLNANEKMKPFIRSSKKYLMSVLTQQETIGER